MGFRIQETDRPLDILRLIAAAKAANCHLELTYDPSHCPIQIDNDWKQTLQEVSFTEENDEDFFERVKRGDFERVRFLQKPPNGAFLAASESATYFNYEPILASGRLELIHYLREVAFSIDYHRYGNLGIREGEIRAEIL